MWTVSSHQEGPALQETERSQERTNATSQDTMKPTVMLCNVFVDILEAAVHQILFLRDIYPANVFTKCLKFGVPIMKADHPWIVKYIADHLKVSDYSQFPK